MTAGNRRTERPDLPAPITRIEPQKRDPGRFSLWSDEQFLTGLSGDTLLRYGIGKGMMITDALFEKIRKREMRIAIRDYLVRLLGRRDHSASELKKKALARNREWNAEEIETEIGSLADKGYLDEERFVRSYVVDKLRLNRWGPVRIRAGLLGKGIDPQLADRILREENDDLELGRICVDLAVRRKYRFAGEENEGKRRMKIAAWLQRRGFTHSTIRKALPDIIEQLNDP